MYNMYVKTYQIFPIGSCVYIEKSYYRIMTILILMPNRNKFATKLSNICIKLMKYVMTKKTISNKFIESNTHNFNVLIQSYSRQASTQF